MQNQLQQPVKYITRWHSDELLGQTLALAVATQSQEIQQWMRRPERLLALNVGPFDDLGDGFDVQDFSGNQVQKLSELRFARLVLRKNLPEQQLAQSEGWHVHAFYPVPQLPLNWADRLFLYLCRYVAGYFVSGVESSGDGIAALAEDLELACAVCSQRLNEALEPLIERSLPPEVAAAFWQEQLNRPLDNEEQAPELLLRWALRLQALIQESEYQTFED